MYDLTPFLTTISSISATILAILGGFITSKIIAIKSERNAVVHKLKNIAEELKIHNSEKAQLEKENHQADALEFIKKYRQRLFAGSTISKVYAIEVQPVLQMNTLKEYWDKALIVSKECLELSKLSETTYNIDGVPCQLECKYKNCFFEYEVCKITVGTFVTEDYRSLIPYMKNKEIINKQDALIRMLELQEEQLYAQTSLLGVPFQIIRGLTIFVLFSAFCIIAPLYLTPFATDNIDIVKVVKQVVIIVFSMHLVFIVGYFVDLLRWPDKPKNNYKDKEWQKLILKYAKDNIQNATDKKSAIEEDVNGQE